MLLQNAFGANQDGLVHHLAVDSDCRACGSMRGGTDTLGPAHFRFARI